MQNFQVVIVDFCLSQMFGGELQRLATQYLGYSNETLSVDQFISVHSPTKAVSSFPSRGSVRLKVRTDCYANSLGATFYPFHQEKRAEDSRACIRLKDIKKAGNVLSLPAQIFLFWLNN